MSFLLSGTKKREALQNTNSVPTHSEYFTAPFKNMRTLKLKARPTNAFFATANLMFGGSSQLPTTAESTAIKSNRWAQFRQHSRKLGGAAEHLIDSSARKTHLSVEL